MALLSSTSSVARTASGLKHNSYRVIGHEREFYVLVRGVPQNLNQMFEILYSNTVDVGNDLQVRGRVSLENSVRQEGGDENQTLFGGCWSFPKADNQGIAPMREIVRCVGIFEQPLTSSRLASEKASGP